MKLTLLSDTHSRHSKIDYEDLPGGDAIIHAGDISSMGYVHEVKNFLGWFNNIPGYTHKIFIAGNHDYLFEQQQRLAIDMVNEYEHLTYLFDNSVEIFDGTYKNKVKIYGSPWQPWFHDWAFNIERDSNEIEAKWNEIPDDVDILITHGPPHQILDKNKFGENCGCERMQKVVLKKNPKIHLFGHIHEAHGYKNFHDCHYFNASVMDASYSYGNKPFNIEWNYNDNSIEFLDK